MPRMQSRAEQGREEGRRGPQIRMPGLRQAFLRRLGNVALRVQADAGSDKEGGDDDHARLPDVGRRLGLGDQPENRPVLEGQMPRRRVGMVDGIEAFRPCLDRRDALRQPYIRQPYGLQTIMPW